MHPIKTCQGLGDDLYALGCDDTTRLRDRGVRLTRVFGHSWRRSVHMSRTVGDLGTLGGAFTPSDVCPVVVYE